MFGGILSTKTSKTELLFKNRNIMAAYQIVKDRLQKIIDKIDEAKDDVDLIKILEEIQNEVEFDLDCAINGH